MKTQGTELCPLQNGGMSSTRSSHHSGKERLKIKGNGGPMWRRTPKNGQECSCPHQPHS